MSRLETQTGTHARLLLGREDFLGTIGVLTSTSIGVLIPKDVAARDRAADVTRTMTLRVEVLRHVQIVVWRQSVFEVVGLHQHHGLHRIYLRHLVLFVQRPV